MDFLNNWTQYIEPEKLSAILIEYGTAIFLALLIYLVGKRIAKLLTRVATKTMLSRGLDETLVKFLGNLIYILLLAFVIIATLSQLGIETTSITAIFAAAGLAIGLALQGSLSNFASGVMLIMFRPFKVGDFIEAAGTAGTVEEISIFTTHLRTADNKAIIVPNAEVTGSTITNYSAKETRRIDLVFGIGYEDDIKKAKNLLETIIKEDDRILKEPEPTVAVSELADSSVNFVVRPWVKTSDYWAVYFHLQETVKLRFDNEGISIPYPQQDVHMHSVQSSG